MIRLLTIIGARPQIIKAAAMSREIRTNYADKIDERILHTGQHYDDNMSDVFFRELGIPAPDYNLRVGSGTHGEQTAKMIEGIENVLLSEPFDGVVTYGDTNSTLAAAVAASKLNIPVYHIEAGLRSYNMSMPEEINRIVCDQLSTILFAPTKTGFDNLAKEGFFVHPRQFGNGMTQRVVLSGDVMYDNAVYFSRLASSKSTILSDLGLVSKQFALATIHRPSNTDNSDNLHSILRALTDIASAGIDVVLPLHPRTRKQLSAEQLGMLTEQLIITSPLPYFDMIRLEQEASIVLTDSGGVQKEAFFYGTPTVILRSETEWVEIVDAGAGILADANYQKMMDAYLTFAGKQINFPPLFGDGHAARIIINEIMKG